MRSRGLQEVSRRAAAFPPDPNPQRARRSAIRGRYARLSWRSAAAVLISLSFCSSHCAKPAAIDVTPRSFDFDRDTFAYTNNNYWVYDLDSDLPGPVVTERLEDVDHGQRCTIMSRAARQFWYAARFDATASKVSDAEYREIVEKILASNPRIDRRFDPPFVIPGYPDLRSLSIERESMLKDTLGGRWIGYFQRGNWRMIFPFSPAQKRATASSLVEDLDQGRLPLVHVFNYPRIDVNHTVLLFDYDASALEIVFDLYDPNNSKQSGSLVYDRATSTFRYWRTDYFAGGLTDVYEVYDGLGF